MSEPPQLDVVVVAAVAFAAVIAWSSSLLFG